MTARISATARTCIIACLWIAMSVTTGCGILGEKDDPTKDWSANKLYTSAKAEMNAGAFEAAIGYLEKLEARYPFGQYAQQARIDLAYAYYRYSEPESAIAAADRFIKLYPNSPYVDYLYYLKGLTNFNRGITFFERFLPTDVAQRDASAQLRSFNDFAELVRRFPDSRYAEDSRRRMLYLRANLARQEVNIASYYVKRKAWVAAANRAKNVITHYEGTPAVRDALVIMIQSYTELGMDDLAANAQAVYDYNEARGTFAGLDDAPTEKTPLGRRIWNLFGLDE